MQITIRGHHLTITPAIEENIKAKFSQMTKHLDHVNSMQIKLAKDHIVSVDLKSKEPEKVYKSYDELEDNQDMHHIIIEMANFYSTRIDLGNLLGRKSKGKSAPTTEATT